MKTKDKIFQIDGTVRDFEFDQNVVEVFNDMLLRSIPFYQAWAMRPPSTNMNWPVVNPVTSEAR